MPEKKKTLHDLVPRINPENRKKLDDLVPDSLMENVRTSRAITELKDNQLKQARIDSALEELRGGQKTIFTGMSLEETAEIVQTLPPERIDEFTLLGVLTDRVKKLEPREARREIEAFLKVWSNRARDRKFYDAGFKVGTEETVAVAKSLGKLSTVEMLSAILESAERSNRTFDSLESG